MKKKNEWNFLDQKFQHAKKIYLTLSREIIGGNNLLSTDIKLLYKSAKAHKDLEEIEAEMREFCLSNT